MHTSHTTQLLRFQTGGADDTNAVLRMAFVLYTHSAPTRVPYEMGTCGCVGVVSCEIYRV